MSNTDRFQVYFHWLRMQEEGKGKTFFPRVFDVMKMSVAQVPSSRPIIEFSDANHPVQVFTWLVGALC